MLNTTEICSFFNISEDQFLRFLKEQVSEILEGSSLIKKLEKSDYKSLIDFIAQRIERIRSFDPSQEMPLEKTVANCIKDWATEKRMRYAYARYVECMRDQESKPITYEKFVRKGSIFIRWQAIEKRGLKIGVVYKKVYKMKKADFISWVQKNVDKMLAKAKLKKNEVGEYIARLISKMMSITSDEVVFVEVVTVQRITRDCYLYFEEIDGSYSPIKMRIKPRSG